MGKRARYKNISPDAAYAVVGQEKKDDFVLFLGNGTHLEANGYTISTTEKGNVILQLKNGALNLHNEVPVVISYQNKEVRMDIGELRLINF